MGDGSAGRGAGVVAGMGDLLRRPVFGVPATAALQFATTFYAMAAVDGEPSGELLQTWGAGAVLLVSLSFVWRGTAPRLDGWFVGNLLFQVGAFQLAIATTGHSLDSGLWVALATVVQALIAAVVYRTLVRREDWAPRSAADLGVLLVACFAACVLSTPLGAWPGLTPGEVWSADAGWWVARGTANMAIGVIPLLLMCHSRAGGPLRVPWPWFQLLLLPAVIGAAYVMFHWPTLPLAWLVILCAVWAGLALTPRLAGLFGIVISVTTAVVGNLQGRPWHREDTPSWGIVVDALSLICVGLAALLPLVRAHRARMGARLAAQGEFMATVFEVMADGVVVTDTRGNLIFANDSATHLLGQTVSPTPPPAWIEHYGLTDADGGPLDESVLPLASTASTGVPSEMDVAVPTPGGGRRVLRVNVRRFSDEDARLVVLLTDVTSRRERQRELMNFAGVVAHDLKSPMTAVRGWLETTRDALAEDDPTTAERSASRAERALHRLDQVVSGWLTYSISRDGALDARPLGIDVLAHDHLAGLAPVDADLRPQVTIRAGHAVLADETLVRELLANLLGNAIKYTPPGETPRIELTTRAAGSFVEVDVRDHGVGIATGEEELIFEEFHRSPGVRDDYQGTGLGLATCKLIVTRHGGTIRAERADGGGTRVVFTLPAA